MPGSDGQITYHVRAKRNDGKGFYFKTVSADFPGAIPDICWNFRNATSNADGSHQLPNKFHCGKCGHRPHLCPLKANTPAPTNVGAVSATQSDAGQLQTLQFDIKELLRTLGQSHIYTLQAVNASAGAGEADIDQLIADAQSKQSNLFMVNVHNEGRTNDAALSLNIDGVRAALDTCARHSVVTPDSWKRLHKAGKASAIVYSGPVYALQGCTKAPSTQVRERTVVTVGRGAQATTVVASWPPLFSRTASILYCHSTTSRRKGRSSTPSRSASHWEAQRFSSGMVRGNSGRNLEYRLPGHASRLTCLLSDTQYCPSRP